MSRTGVLILLGVLVIITPFSGLPIALRSLLSVVFGAAVVSIGLYMRVSDARAKRDALGTDLTPPSPTATDLAQDHSKNVSHGVSPI